MKLDHRGASRPLCGFQGFPGGTVVKSPPVDAEDSGDAVLIPGSGRPPGEGHGNPLQYFCLENPTEEPGELQSMRSQRVRHDLATEHRPHIWLLLSAFYYWNV